MSSISAEPAGFFDFETYALPAEALRSLPALQAPWRDHLLRQAESVPADPDFRHFLALTAELPVSIGEVGWQQQWMRAWYRLHGRDCSPARLQQLLHADVAQAHAIQRVELAHQHKVQPVVGQGAFHGRLVGRGFYHAQLEIGRAHV